MLARTVRQPYACDTSPATKNVDNPGRTRRTGHPRTWASALLAVPNAGDVEAERLDASMTLSERATPGHAAVVHGAGVAPSFVCDPAPRDTTAVATAPTHPARPEPAHRPGATHDPVLRRTADGRLRQRPAHRAR